MIVSNIFKDKKIFITGHTGFKGSWLVLMLQHLGARIKGYSVDVPAGGIFQKAKVDTFCEHVLEDIRNGEKLKKEILEWEPDFVFHLAAQPLVLASYKQPLETFDVNIMGTAYLLDSLRYLQKACVAIIITTDKVYENQEWSYTYRETDPLGGYDPYSASKAASELVVGSYRQSYFSPASYQTHLKAVATARAGNVIGGGDVAENRIIPDIANALRAGSKVTLRHPNAIRPWQHVMEALHGYLSLAAAIALAPENSTLHTAWNFGPLDNDVLTVEDLTKIAIECWGAGSYEVHVVKGHLPKETYNLSLSTAKARHLLRWQPRWNSNLAIKHTVNWYKHELSQDADMKSFSLQQIREYLLS